MSSLYDQEMLRRMTAPPGYQPPKPRGQEDQPPPYQPLQIMRGGYGGGEPPPYPQMSVRTTRLAQTDPRTGMTVFSDDPVAEEMHRGANQFNMASAENYNRQQFASQQAAQQMALEREKMQQAATLGREEMKNRIDVARIGADADRNWGKMTDQLYKDTYMQELMKHGDTSLAARQANAAVASFPVGPPNSPRGVPGAAPGAGLPPGVPAVPPQQGGGTTPTLLPAAIKDLLGTSGVVPPGEGAKKLDAGKLADLLFNEQGRLKGAYGELADQLMASGVPPQNVIDAIQQHLLTLRTRSGHKGPVDLGGLTIRQTYGPPDPSIFDAMASNKNMGGEPVEKTPQLTGYAIEGQDVPNGGIWYNARSPLGMNRFADWLPTVSNATAARSKAQMTLLADMLRQIYKSAPQAGQAPPPPPR